MKPNILAKIIADKKSSIIFILFFVGLAYLNTFVNQFVMDDNLFIVDWPLIKTWHNFVQFFGPNNQPVGEGGVYSPFKTVLHALNYHLFKGQPFGYHLVALFIHFLGVALVYNICLLLSGNKLGSFLAGLIFGLHPVNTEAITFLTASVDSLGVVFLFIAFYFYARSSRFDKNYLLAVLFSVLAIFTHELAIVLPILFLLYDLMLRREKSAAKEAALKILPFFAVAVFYIILKFINLGSVARGGYLLGSFYLTLPVTIKAWAKYILILLFPFRLAVNPQISDGIYAVDWQFFDRVAVLSQSILDWQVIGSLILILAVIILGIKLYRRQPLISFCAAWFFISLLPVSNIIPTECYFAQRYLYLAGLGFAAGLGLGLAYLLEESRLAEKHSRVIAYFVVSLLFFYGFRTILRNSDWQNENAFALAEQRAYPESPEANRNLGVVFLSYGRINEALKLLNKSIQILPLADTYFALSQAYYAANDIDREVAGLKKAIELDDKFAEACYNLAAVEIIRGRKEAARPYLTKAVNLFDAQGKKDLAAIARSLYDKTYRPE